MKTNPKKQYKRGIVHVHTEHSNGIQIGNAEGLTQYSLNKRVADKPGRVGEERDYDDVDVTNAGGDSIRPV